MTALTRLSVCILLLSGCYRYAPLTVAVVDATTRQPVPGAHVRSDYESEMFHAGPKTAAAITNVDGMATLRVADDPFGVSIVTESQGYEPDEVSICPKGSNYRSPPAWKKLPWPYPPLTVDLQPTKRER